MFQASKGQVWTLHFCPFAAPFGPRSSRTEGNLFESGPRERPLCTLFVHRYGAECWMAPICLSKNVLSGPVAMPNVNPSSPRTTSRPNLSSSQDFGLLTINGAAGEVEYDDKWITRARSDPSRGEAEAKEYSALVALRTSCAA